MTLLSFRHYHPVHLISDCGAGSLYLYRGFLNTAAADWAFKYFNEHTQWEQDQYTFSGRTVKAPRLTALYGEGNYVYSGVTKCTNGWNHSLQALTKHIEEELNYVFNSVLLNYYEDGQSSIGMHSDDEPELGVDPTVCSLSLGGSRVFNLRNKHTQEETPLELNNGDLLIMGSGIQAAYQHGIAKCYSATPRISLTFRTIV